MSLDRYGHIFDELVNIQTRQLDGWVHKLTPDVHRAVTRYVITHRVERGGAEEHQVFRGQDLVQIILQWPDVLPPYPANGEGVI